jgi:hypothetical protein
MKNQQAPSTLDRSLHAAPAHRVKLRRRLTWRGWRYSYSVHALTPTGGESDVIFFSNQQYSRAVDAETALLNAARSIANDTASWILV